MAKIRTEQEDGEFYLVVDEVRIAKRGQPGTPQAGTWISLVPGWEVGGTIGRIISPTTGRPSTDRRKPV